MKVNIKNRFVAFGIIVAILFVVLFIQLIHLTIVKGEHYADLTGALERKVISVPGARGSILDRNGLPLAYDQKSYDVQFYKDPTRNSSTERAYYTGIIIDAIDVIEKNGGRTVDTFSIRYDEQEGIYEFDWGDISEEAKVSREERWRSNMFVGTKRTPEEIYLYLREKYHIPSEMGYAQAIKVLSIWQDVQLGSWRAFEPIDIAYNVSIQTVAEIETHKVELEGMSIADSTVRIYPRDHVAAHTIGYLGKIIDEDKLEEYKKLGYNVDDLVGIEGIEQSMEEILTGNSSERQGVREVEVDNMKVVVNELSSTEPTQGNNVMLTIDVPLQEALEDSLAKNVPEIRKGQLDEYEKEKDDKYEDIEDISKVDLANSGAAVVLDVRNGEVLAMGSYPSFDLNLFTGGIPYDTYEALKDDPATPLFNKAVSSRATPGSIFKMLTGLAGLMEGETTLSEKIDDEGKYTAHLVGEGRAPKCWVYPAIYNHQDQTIVEALQHSCNYYFFTIADRLHIDLLNKWGDKFGLTASTGIEIPGEAIGQIGNQEILYNPELPINKQKTFIPLLVKEGQYGIVKLLNGFAEEREVEYDEDLIDSTAEELIKLAGREWVKIEDSNLLRDPNNTDVTMGDHIRNVLSKNLNIPEKVSKSRQWDDQISSMLTQLIWNPYDTITTGIGQGYVQVTPIAVARYVAALVNGGTVYETHVVDKIVAQDGTVILDKEPVVYDTLDADEEYLEAIKQGMAEVVSGEEGTAASRFENFKYKDQIGGKTGTAQVSTIDLENNSWFVCFAPYDKDDPSVQPEIAVVVYVPNGFSGGLSSLVAQDIVEFYLDRKKMVAKQTIPDVNALVVTKAEDTESGDTDDAKTQE